MECPYCKQPMRDGAIPAEGVQLCWYPRGENGEVDTSDCESCVPLSKRPVFRLTEYLAQAWYCEGCRRIVLDVPEEEKTKSDLERSVDRVAQTIDRMAESASQKIKDRGAAQREKREERQREKRRNQDPWEVK